MSKYFGFYFDKQIEVLVKRFFLGPNPFGITKDIRRVGSSVFADSQKRRYQLYDGGEYSHWEFYSEMESIFHFKAKSVLETGDIDELEDVREKREFADILDRQKIPFYLLAQTNHNAWVLIRGLTKEKEGIINPNCNTFGIEDTVLDLVKGLNYREHEFAKDYLAR